MGALVGSTGRGLVAAGLAAVLLGGPALAAGGGDPAAVTLDLGEGEGQFASRIVQIILLVTAISLAPAIVVAATAFVRIIVTLSILRSALGLHQTPPNMVLVSLALFLTAFVMAPTLERTWSEGLQPLMNEEVEVADGVGGAIDPLRDFMETHVQPGHLAAFERLIGLYGDDAPTASDTVASTTGTGLSDGVTPLGEDGARDGDVSVVGDDQAEAGDRPPLRALAPAFIVSELSRAFEMGFLLFLPFLVIDLVVAAVLMSMGMMMLPPAVVSLPFKLIFLVFMDGWRLVSEGLALSFVT